VSESTGARQDNVLARLGVTGMVWRYTTIYTSIAVTIILVLACYELLTRADRQIVVDCSSHLVVCQFNGQQHGDETEDSNSGPATVRALRDARYPRLVR
jgi:hypothetical protein